MGNISYRTSSHSKYLCLYHIILVCKYRHKLLIKLGDIIKLLIEEIGQRYDFTIETMEVDEDHIHILVNCNSNLSPKDLVTTIKKITTYRVWRLDDSITKYLRKYIWYKKKFWSEGSFVCTIGNASEETIRKYIESQG